MTTVLYLLQIPGVKDGVGILLSITIAFQVVLVGVFKSS